MAEISLYVQIRHIRNNQTCICPAVMQGELFLRLYWFRNSFFISFGTCVYVSNVIKLICYREKEWMCKDLSW